jgi:hypothetical protein
MQASADGKGKEEIVLMQGETVNVCAVAIHARGEGWLRGSGERRQAETESDHTLSWAQGAHRSDVVPSLQDSVN